MHYAIQMNIVAPIMCMVGFASPKSDCPNSRATITGVVHLYLICIMSNITHCNKVYKEIHCAVDKINIHRYT